MSDWVKKNLIYTVYKRCILKRDMHKKKRIEYRRYPMGILSRGKMVTNDIYQINFKVKTIERYNQEYYILEERDNISNYKIIKLCSNATEHPTP